MSRSLNSPKKVIQGIIWGTAIGDIKGDTRSLGYGSYESSKEGSPTASIFGVILCHVLPLQEFFKIITSGGRLSSPHNSRVFV